MIKVPGLVVSSMLLGAILIRGVEHGFSHQREAVQCFTSSIWKLNSFGPYRNRHREVRVPSAQLQSN